MRNPKARSDLRAVLEDVIAATRLNRPIESIDEAVALSLLYTRKLIDGVARRFFAGKPITESEFDVLMILYDYRRTPLKQAELAGMLLVTRLGAREILQRLERKGLIERAAHEDQRARAIRISKAGERALVALRTEYYRMLRDQLGRMKDGEKAALLAGQRALRRSLRPDT